MGQNVSSLLNLHEPFYTKLYDAQFQYRLIKSIGYIRLALILISITNIPRPRLWFFYGWMWRLWVSTGLVFGLYRYGYSVRYHIAAMYAGLMTYRLYCYWKTPCSFKNLNDMHEHVLSRLPKMESRYFTTRDGVNLHYYTIGTGSKMILLANGLGGRIFVWHPVLEMLKNQDLFSEYTFVSWDYRGLFESSVPAQSCQYSVRDHADDCLEIIDMLKPESVVMIGWSTGVQVGLQVALLVPAKISHLILLNGSPGHTLQASCQPFFRLPWFGNVLTDILTILQQTGFLWGPLFSFLRNHSDMIRILFCMPHAVNSGNRFAEWLNLQGVGKNHTLSYIRMFQELDAHSVTHLLHEIETPTLIISGFTDMLTPSYLSYEMARVIPKSTLKCYTLSGHFTILDYPQEVATDIVGFITKK